MVFKIYRIQWCTPDTFEKLRLQDSLQLFINFFKLHHRQPMRYWRTRAKLFAGLYGLPLEIIPGRVLPFFHKDKFASKVMVAGTLEIYTDFFKLH